MNNYFEYLLSKFIKKSHLKSILNSRINNKSKVCAGSLLYNVTMDRYSDIGYDCSIVNTNIGAFCSLGANIRIGGASHTINWVSTSPVFNSNKDHLKKKFSKHEFEAFSSNNIGNDVWIGDNVLIKSGISIGDGAIIGMGSVVTKDIPPYEIWGGNPAKFIKKRFDNNIIDSLLEIKWWNLSEKEIQKYAPYFNSPELFIQRFNN